MSTKENENIADESAEDKESSQPDSQNNSLIRPYFEMDESGLVTVDAQEGGKDLKENEIMEIVRRADPNQKIPLYHGTEAPADYLTRIAHSEQHGVRKPVDGTPTFSVLKPLPQYWHGGGLVYLVRRSDISLPEEASDKPMRVKEGCAYLRNGSHQSLYDYEGYLAVGHRRGLSRHETETYVKEQIAAENLFFKSAREKLHPLHTQIKRAVADYDFVLKGIGSISTTPDKSIQDISEIIHKIPSDSEGIDDKSLKIIEEANGKLSELREYSQGQASKSSQLKDEAKVLDDWISQSGAVLEQQADRIEHIRKELSNLISKKPEELSAWARFMQGIRKKKEVSDYDKFVNKYDQEVPTIIASVYQSKAKKPQVSFAGGEHFQSLTDAIKVFDNMWNGARNAEPKDILKSMLDLRVSVSPVIDELVTDSTNYKQEATQLDELCARVDEEIEKTEKALMPIFDSLTAFSDEYNSLQKQHEALLPAK
jgi:predicted nuclease with TOPRIM domain